MVAMTMLISNGNTQLPTGSSPIQRRATSTTQGESKPIPSESIVPIQVDSYLEHEWESESDAGDVEDTQPTVSADGERPSSWKTALYSGLVRVVAEAKGAASRRVVRFVKKQLVHLEIGNETFAYNNSLRGTKLIFVVGQSGTGKSTMLKEVTGQDLTIGKGITSGKVYILLD